MILCAGFGTRLYPLTCDVPKPLIPLWGRPLIDHTLDWLQRQGVRDVLLNLHHNSEAFLEWTRTSPRTDVRLSFSFEPQILGTGGALAKARWFLEQEPVWLVNGDVAFDVDVAPILRSVTHETASVSWLHPDLGPRTVGLNEDGLIQSFRCTPGGPGQGTLCGLHWIHPRLLAHVPEPPAFCSLVDIWERALRGGQRVLGALIPESYWADLGTPERLLQAHRDTLDAASQKRPGARLYRPQQWPRGVMVTGVAACSPGAEVRPGARLQDSILWPGARAGARSRLCGAIVGRGVHITGRASGPQVRAEKLLPRSLLQHVETLGWKGPETYAEFLGARGSDRSFFRLRCGSRTGVLVQYGRAREENDRYAGATLFLQAHGLRVPALLVHEAETRHLLFEDLGSRSLQDLAPGGRHWRAAYGQAIDQLAALHRLARPAQKELRLMPPFNRALYRWEHELFCTHYLKSFPVSSTQRAALQIEFARLTRRLCGLEPDLLHRDYQSSNLMWYRNEVRMIDYQGLRLGPATYDLASLLCDPYVNLGDDLRADLLNQYIGLRPERKNQIETTFWPAAIQRLLQAMGAYARLSTIPGQERFASYLLPARLQCLAAIKQVPGFSVLQELLQRDLQK